MSPAWLAVIVQLPVPASVTVATTRVQAPEVAKLTGNPELAVALTMNGGSPNVLFVSESVVSVQLTDKGEHVIRVTREDRKGGTASMAIVQITVVGEKVDESLVIRELCISCRALGRHLEDIMIGYALDRMIESFDTSTVVFKYQKAPRNDPALKWLEQFTKVSVVGDEMEISLNNRDIPIVNPAHLSALKINTYPQPRST